MTPMKIVLLPGDGIGPEVVAAAAEVAGAVASHFGVPLDCETHLIGGHAIEETGAPLPADTIQACQEADAVLMGAVGGPRWEDPSARVRPEQGLLNLRRGLQLYASIRPVKAYPALFDVSPVKAELLRGVDLIVVRELTGGIYFGAPRFREPTSEGIRAVDTMEYTDDEVRRVVRLACRLASGRRQRVTSVDKSNVLESSRLWRQITSEVASDFPDITLEHRLVDSAAMRLITEPQTFDVIVTHNMFGDILSNESSVLSGSLGLLASASIGDSGPGLFEPVHGSAPDIEGMGIANPVGAILSAALMFRHSLGQPQAADLIEEAVEQAIDEGARTRDLGGQLSTRAMTDAILAKCEAARPAHSAVNPAAL